MKEYTFVEKEDFKVFEEMCSKLLQDGWVAQGGIATHAYWDRDGDLCVAYLQAFVR